MELWLAWLIVGFVLVTIELATGTFYLLVLGLGAFAGSLTSYLGGNVLVQAFVAAAVAIVGAWLVHSWHAKNRGTDSAASNFLDKGQPAVLESWVDEKGGLVRVKYRGTSWDARVVGATRPSPGAMLYIESQEGSLLLVTPTAPSAS